VVTIALLGHQSTSSYFSASSSQSQPQQQSHSPSRPSRSKPELIGAQLTAEEREFQRKDHYGLEPLTSGSLMAQVNQEFRASDVYMQMYAHFSKNTVAKKGFAKFFLESSDEERQHGLKLINYMNLRGHREFDALNVPMPIKTSWDSPKEAIENCITLEKDLLAQLQLIHKRADTKQDPHLMDFLEQHYLSEQINSIDQLTRILSILNSLGDGQEQLAAYHVDKQLLKDGSTGMKYFDEL